MSMIFLIKDDDTVSYGGGTTTHLATSTKEIADEYLTAMNTSKDFFVRDFYADEVIVDIGLDKLREGYRPYHVHLYRDNKPNIMLEWDMWYQIVSRGPTKRNGPNYWNAYILARSTEEAWKLASELEATK